MREVQRLLELLQRQPGAVEQRLEDARLEAGEAAGRALEKGVPDPAEARGIIKAASD